MVKTDVEEATNIARRSLTTRIRQQLESVTRRQLKFNPIVTIQCSSEIRSNIQPSTECDESDNEEETGILDQQEIHSFRLKSISPPPSTLSSNNPVKLLKTAKERS
ncbi:hypothetical protein DINM_001268 [Dirofilaria immitis]|nr:hypothetical protein [Dirofilaria immitis]